MRKFWSVFFIGSLLLVGADVTVRRAASLDLTRPMTANDPLGWPPPSVANDPLGWPPPAGN